LYQKFKKKKLIKSLSCFYSLFDWI